MQVRVGKPLSQRQPAVGSACLLLRLGSRSDAELLRRFLDGQQADAFEVLLERHGPWVLGICQRILGCPAEAEDAAQATFLVLIRKAGSLRDPDRLSSWLHGVATRVAMRARKVRQRRLGFPLDNASAQVVDRAQDRLREIGDVSEWAELIHRELQALPARLRDPVILCDLQGLTREEAARRLNCPIGTLHSRISRARRRLRDRLAREGLHATLAIGASLESLAWMSGLPVSPQFQANTAAMARCALLGQAELTKLTSAQVLALTPGALPMSVLPTAKFVAIAAMTLLTCSTVAMTTSPLLSTVDEPPLPSWLASSLDSQGLPPTKTHAGLTDPSSDGSDHLLFEFRNGEAESLRWELSEGLSSGFGQDAAVSISDQGTLRVNGTTLSFDNNPVPIYSYVKTRLQRDALTDFEGLVVRIRGDGQTYQLLVNTEASVNGSPTDIPIDFLAPIKTVPGTWQTWVIPFDRLRPTIWGDETRAQTKAFDPTRATKIGLALSDEQNRFKLEIDWIRGYTCRDQVPADWRQVDPPRPTRGDLRESPIANIPAEHEVRFVRAVLPIDQQVWILHGYNQLLSVSTRTGQIQTRRILGRRVVAGQEQPDTERVFDEGIIGASTDGELIYLLPVGWSRGIPTLVLDPKNERIVDQVVLQGHDGHPKERVLDVTLIDENLVVLWQPWDRIMDRLSRPILSQVDARRGQIRSSTPISWYGGKTLVTDRRNLYVAQPTYRVASGTRDRSHLLTPVDLTMGRRIPSMPSILLPRTIEGQIGWDAQGRLIALQREVRNPGAGTQSRYTTDRQVLAIPPDHWVVEAE